MNNVTVPQLSRALVMCVNFNRDPDFDEILAEGIALVESARYEILYTLTMNRQSVDAKFFVGSGKVEEIKAICNTYNIGSVIVNHNLSSVQERNLEVELQVPVIDRTKLILDIFASRVKSNEGVLQVELACQTHQLSRLVKRWSHLERQRGGIGLRGGPGEKQVELDRRMIADKIKALKARLAIAVKQRQTQRKSRLKQKKFSVSIVGYTNAGKSTVFNLLTKANVYAENRLFATLETTSRRLFLSEGSEVVVSDTVGFIRDLPHSLVAAFRATLEETIHADLLLHIVDISHILRDRQVKDVNLVLKEIKADNIAQLIVYNKIDLNDTLYPRIEYSIDGEPLAVYVSAIKNIGFDLLRQAIELKIIWLNQNNVKQQELVYEPWKH